MDTQNKVLCEYLRDHLGELGPAEESKSTTAMVDVSSQNERIVKDAQATEAPVNPAGTHYECAQDHGASKQSKAQSAAYAMRAWLHAPAGTPADLAQMKEQMERLHASYESAQTFAGKTSCQDCSTRQHEVLTWHVCRTAATPA